MIDEARTSSPTRFAGGPPLRIGVSRLARPLPGWKRDADFLFAQVSFSAEAQLRWREANPVDMPVYAGVMVLASAQMARRLAAAIPYIDIPGWLVDQVAADRTAGVDAAVQQIQQLRDSGAFQGVPLVPVGRYREVSARLENLH